MNWLVSLLQQVVSEEVARTIVFIMMGSIFVGLHFYIRISRWILAPLLVIFGLIYEVMGMAGREENIPIELMVGVLFFYGSLLYVLLVESLLGGWSEYLTQSRGEKWVRELDYIYLLFGALGIVASVNRLQMLSTHYSGSDVYASLAITAAIVIRLIKTRAEIGGWNKEPMPIDTRPPRKRP